MEKNNIISVQEQLLLEDLKKYLPTQYEIFPNTYKRLTPIVNKVIEDAINIKSNIKPLRNHLI